MNAQTAFEPVHAVTPAPRIDSDRLVFVGGLHRSGTSLIHRCLSDHSQISGFHGTGVPEDEGQHLQTVYPTAGVFGGPGRFGLNPASHMDETSPLATAANAELLLREWLFYWNQDKQYLVEKSPPNVVRTRFLQALFPESKFIIVQRHPIAVSYATQKWTPRGTWIGDLIEHWLVCHERFERDRPHLRNVHVLRYEDFVAQPQKELDAVFRFLELPTERLQREVRAEVSDRYFKRWSKLRRNPLALPYTKSVIRKFEERVQRFGYSLVDLAHKPGGSR